MISQYLVTPPLEFITAWHRFLMESTKLAVMSGVMEFQVLKIKSFNSSLFLTGVLSIFFLIISHRCSMGFRSGLYEGHGKTEMWLAVNQSMEYFAVWHFAPSCWKMKSSPIILSPSSFRVCEIRSMYALAFKRPSTTCKLPSLSRHIHPQTWIFPPPNLTVDTRQSWWSFSPTLLLTLTLLPGTISKTDSSDHSILAHWLCCQNRLSFAQLNRADRCLAVSIGFLAAMQPLSPACRSLLLTVLVLTEHPEASCSSLFNCLDDALGLLTSNLSSRLLVCLGLPDLGLSLTLPVSSFFVRIFCTAQRLTFSLAAMARWEYPSSLRVTTENFNTQVPSLRQDLLSAKAAAFLPLTFLPLTCTWGNFPRKLLHILTISLATRSKW